MMRIIAYISVRHYLFSRMIPGMNSKDFEIFPLNLQEVLLKLDANNLRNEFSSFWDYLLDNDHYDLVWSYHRPDEISLSKCRERNIPVMVQEFFGWKPFRLSAVFPLDCDFEKAYGKESAGTEGTPRPNECPVITIPLEKTPLSKERAIENSVRKYHESPSSLELTVPYWDTDPLISSRMNFLKLALELIKSNDELKRCRVMVRPDPEYPELFAEETEYINRLGDSNVRLDFSGSGESLRNTDIIVCINTNYGVDGIRAGCEVISYGNKTFFSNPQLVKMPENISGLETAIVEAAGKIRAEGKKLKPFMPRLIQDMQGPLGCTCEHPYDHVRMKEALKYAFNMPSLVKQ